MGLDPVSWGLIASAVIGTASAYEGRRSAANSARDAAAQQRKAQEEQRAVNAAQAAQERRQQIREERVKQARILQAAKNTGTEGSSGEIGAVNSISTQVESNIGFNLGAVMHGDSISAYNQEAANFNTSANSALTRAANAKALFDLSGNIFSTVATPSSKKPSQGGENMFSTSIN